MLIYEKVVGGVRKLFGTLGTAPSDADNELSVTPAFDFDGKYFYKAPGGIMTADGTEVTVKIGGETIIPPQTIVDTKLDEYEELVDDKGTPEDTTDDELRKVYTQEELEAMTKATIAQMAEVLGYTGIDMTMTKTEMITAFLAAQTADGRANGGGE